MRQKYLVIEKFIFSNNSSGAHAHNNHHNSNHSNSREQQLHSNSREQQLHSNSSSNSWGAGQLRDWDRGEQERGRGVSECSTGDATPTSEGEGECGGGDPGSTHAGGAVSLSAALSRISQPQVSDLCHIFFFYSLPSI